jgi:hypothetical protein
LPTNQTVAGRFHILSGNDDPNSGTLDLSATTLALVVDLVVGANNRGLSALGDGKGTKHQAIRVTDFNNDIAPSPGQRAIPSGAAL